MNDKLAQWTLKHRHMPTEPESQQALAHTVTVTQDQGIEFEVTISKFHVQPGDTVSYRWHDGKDQRFLEMPPYRILDDESARNNMLHATAQGKETSINILLRDAHPIQRRTIEAARKYLKGTQVSSEGYESSFDRSGTSTNQLPD